MIDVAFIVADPVAHRNELISLHLEYMSWVSPEIERASGLTFHAVAGMCVPEYVASVINALCGDPPPRGVFYLIEVDGKIVGMCGLRFIREGVTEIKRLYVRPSYRGMHIGESALQRLLTDARAFGYKEIYLDSAPFMKSAHRLYEAMGFSDCQPYVGTEAPVALRGNWRFMRQSL
jgi:GNAT superfamily N-acetyltransferase